MIRAFLLFLSLLAVSPVRAAETRVAVAANFTAAAQDIAAGFAHATGHRAILAFGPSGGLLTQIEHGAPFDVLLSADAERPAKAETEGLGVKGSRFTYAVGRLALYAKQAGLIGGDAAALLRSDRYSRLAIADPAVAPYGAAAMDTLAALRVSDAVRSRIVKGASISQAYQFVASGAAELGFVALSEVIAVPGGSRWIVPASLHAPIVQQAMLLKNGAGNPAATAFLTYLRGSEARAIIRRHGYAVR